MGEVYRCTNFGGYYRKSASGGSGMEYYGVIGFGPAESVIHLPAIGDKHVDPRLDYIGTVQYVELVQEFGPLGLLYRVYYSVGGTFNFGLLLGMSTTNDIEPTVVPVIHTVGTGFIAPEPRVTIPRYCITKRITSRATVSLDVITEITAENLGKVYTFGGRKYQLCGAPATQDSGNNIRVDTRFRYRGPLAGYAVNAFDGMNRDIPDLPENSDWIPNVRNGLVTTTSAPEDGEALPWLA